MSTSLGPHAFKKKKNSHYENVNFKYAKNRFICKRRKGNNAIPLTDFSVLELNAELVTRTQRS